MILLDTSGLLCALDAAQPDHASAAALLATAEPPLLLSPFVLAELDHLLGRRVGPHAQRALLSEVGAGAYRLDGIGADGVRRAAAVVERYPALGIGLADASLVVLSERHECLDLLTLDERHFRTVLGTGDRPFRLLPADAG